MLQSRSFEKKLVKPLKNCFLDPICTEKRSLWATPKMEKFFFGRNNKSRSSAFRKFLFYQNICFDWVMNLFLSWVMFSVKKVSFPAKTSVISRFKQFVQPWIVRFFHQVSCNKWKHGKCQELLIFDRKLQVFISYLNDVKWKRSMACSVYS